MAEVRAQVQQAMYVCAPRQRNARAQSRRRRRPPPSSLDSKNSSSAPQTPPFPTRCSFEAFHRRGANRAGQYNDRLPHFLTRLDEALFRRAASKVRNGATREQESRHTSSQPFDCLLSARPRPAARAMQRRARGRWCGPSIRTWRDRLRALAGPSWARRADANRARTPLFPLPLAQPPSLLPPARPFPRPPAHPDTHPNNRRSTPTWRRSTRGSRRRPRC